MLQHEYSECGFLGRTRRNDTKDVGKGLSCIQMDRRKATRKGTRRRKKKKDKEQEKETEKSK